MADSNPFSPDQWLETQRKYWDAWMDLTRQGLAGTAPAEQRTAAATTPWANALEQWWKAVSAGTSPVVQDFYDRLVGLGKAYFALGENLAESTDQGPQAGAVATAWIDNLRKTFDAMSRSFVPQQGQQVRDFMAFWDLPLDTWQRTVSSFSPFPGDFLKALHPEGVPQLGGDLREHLDRFLSIPGVGYSREAQDQYQNLGKLLLDYQRALQEYSMGLAKVGTESVDLFQRKLTETAAAEGPVTSLRALYNLWVDACEEVYAEYTMTDEYAALYGELVNTLMALKHQGSLLVEEVLEALNVPTHRELNTVHKRLQEMRCDYRTVRKELEQLKRQLAAATARGAPAAPSTRRAATPARKKTAKKNATTTRKKTKATAAKRTASRKQRAK